MPSAFFHMVINAPAGMVQNERTCRDTATIVGATRKNLKRRTILSGNPPWSCPGGI